MNKRIDQQDDRGDCPLLTIIVPVFNEARTVSEVLRRLNRLVIRKEIIVVDDGSTDGTGQLLDEWIGSAKIRVLNHSVNRGKGAAIRTALDFATGQFVIVQDGDLETDPAQIPQLVEPLVRGEADIVVGNRFSTYRTGFFRQRILTRIGITALNCVFHLLYGQRLSDEPSCYKVLATTNLRAMNLQCEGFEFCPEVVAKACRLGLRFSEVAVSYSPRASSDGKKLRFRDGLVAIRTLWRYRSWNSPSRR